jgi:hypothetical protein
VLIWNRIPESDASSAMPHTWTAAAPGTKASSRNPTIKVFIDR